MSEQVPVYGDIPELTIPAQPRRGTLFYHSMWVDTDQSDRERTRRALCEVTQVRQGVVWWALIKSDGTRAKKRYTFPVAMWSDLAKATPWR